MKYKVTAALAVTYTIDAEDEEDAIASAKGYLLKKIDNRDVAYDELKARATWASASNAMTDPEILFPGSMFKEIKL